MPAAAITPAWRIPPPSRARCVARRGDHVASGRTATSRPARRAPSRGRTSRCRRRATSSRGRDAERDGGVPDARAVDVHARARRRARGRDTASISSARQRPPATPACGCSRSRSSDDRRAGGALDRRRRVDVVGARARRRRRRAGAAARPRSPARRRVLVAVHVRARRGTAPRCPAGASTRSASWFAIVPDGTNSAASLPSSAGRERLEPVDGRVLAVHVVADLGVGHRAPHLRRRRRDRVGAEVDRRDQPSCSRPLVTGPCIGRMSPSWITVTASVPSRAEDVALARARARPTPTGSSGGTAATRRRGTAGGTTSRGRGSRS